MKELSYGERMLLQYMTGEYVSLFIQTACLLLTIIYAALYRRKGRAFIVGILLMTFANFFGQLCIAGEGPSVFVGIVILPLEGVFVAWITIVILNGINRIRSRRQKKT